MRPFHCVCVVLIRETLCSVSESLLDSLSKQNPILPDEFVRALRIYEKELSFVPQIVPLIPFFLNRGTF
ncbi:hypothetical protein CH380_11595 [Leptospira adleri]|uniref:Uncharacterized protein n=1 Tax=Leptospira adleri TaxID=2023186 RepID=A0A2M9YNF5_9LEPT|nr:hypothetical protein CH380_11595 [Leptospira adleri]PJZ62612.1 hypothetical protein CH376_07375 [Leptospira adleri]